MGQSGVSPSDGSIVKPASLTERLAEAEANGDIPSSGEPTSFSMAQRFAPEGQKSPNDGPVGSLLQSAAIPEARSAPSLNRGLLAATILIALFPTAILLALLWESGVGLRGYDFHGRRTITVGLLGQLVKCDKIGRGLSNRKRYELAKASTPIQLSAAAIVTAGFRCAPEILPAT
jgi:hypothetical protein